MKGLIDNIKGTLEGLFAPEQQQQLNVEDVEGAFAAAGINIADLARQSNLAAQAAERIAKAAADTPTTTMDDSGGGGGGGGLGGAGRSASLTGALKDLQLSFRMFIGDQEIEDLVVYAIAEAAREGRITGVSVQ